MKFAAIQIQQLNNKKLANEKAAAETGSEKEIEDAKNLVKQLTGDNREKQPFSLFFFVLS